MSKLSPYETHPLQVKICGLTRAEDIRWASKCGADFLGLILCQSKRQLKLEEALRLVALSRREEISGEFIAVVQEPDDALIEHLVDGGFDGFQLHGDESPERASELFERWEDLWVWKAVRLGSDADIDRIEAFETEPILLDAWSAEAAGGTGKRIPVAAEKIRLVTETKRVILAGGLDPENVVDAVIDLEPWAVDVSSGVESTPGVKDRKKVKRFVDNAKNTAVVRALASRQGHEEEPAEG
jgi:phosphoribosylanthranilate isomerase